MTDRSSVDCLPPGWNVEVRLRKNGKRDKLYTDPVSGYVFRSMKDVSRYLETGKLGRLAFKPKGKGIIGVLLGDDNILVGPLVTEFTHFTVHILVLLFGYFKGMRDLTRST
ncbi:hypothetical protein I3842_04G065700 [Carya illinoinensis]|uniref:MBD domain-containing protein n=1 Tax=Carya illinoinensis TaxID=32201 RepID=A0A922JTS9_CARIL|nr:hypothetical protein I3842_04G065700 [Carya illinoinensis]